MNKNIKAFMHSSVVPVIQNYRSSFWSAYNKAYCIRDNINDNMVNPVHRAVCSFVCRIVERYLKEEGI